MMTTMMMMSGEESDAVVDVADESEMDGESEQHVRHDDDGDGDVADDGKMHCCSAAAADGDDAVVDAIDDDCCCHRVVCDGVAVAAAALVADTARHKDRLQHSRVSVTTRTMMCVMRAAWFCSSMMQTGS